MKNLNLFLWIFTTAIATFFAYHTYTHTRLRYKDLESVMMQNLAQEKGVKTIKLQTENQYIKSSILVGRFGNSKRDIVQLNKAMNIRKQAENISVMISNLNAIAKNTNIDEKWQINERNTNLLSSLLINFPYFVAKQDTSLKNLGKSFSLSRLTI